MSKTDLAASNQNLDRLISEIRGHKVMLDADLAKVYGIPTSRLNEAVKRNSDRFPIDFAFQLTPEEFTCLISQIAISSSGHGGRRKRPWVFTEHGAIMAANVLNCPQAIQMPHLSLPAAARRPGDFGFLKFPDS